MGRRLSGFPQIFRTRNQLVSSIMGLNVTECLFVPIMNSIAVQAVRHTIFHPKATCDINTIKLFEWQKMCTDWGVVIESKRWIMLTCSLRRCKFMFSHCSGRDFCVMRQHVSIHKESRRNERHSVISNRGHCSNFPVLIRRKQPWLHESVS